MNYALLPPTAHAAVADRVDCEFRSLDVAAHATALAFDAGGHYLAAGYGDGSLLVSTNSSGLFLAACQMSRTTCAAVTTTPRLST